MATLPTITYGAFTIDFNTLPEASVTAMIRRGVSHFFGSEQASKVTAKFTPDEDGNLETADTKENRDAAKAEFQAKAHEALLAGTVGVSTRGPAPDPIGKIINRLAKAEVTTLLVANGVKPPKKTDDVVETPDGSKFTMAELIARRIAKHGERITTDAKRIMVEQAKKAAKAEAAAKSEGLTEL